jgi:hypothetical protein
LAQPASSVPALALSLTSAAEGIAL